MGMKRVLMVVLLGSCAWLGNAKAESESIMAADLAGAWQLVSYTLPDTELEVSGLLLMHDGHFAMDYGMLAPGGTPSARSHSGTYRVEPGQLVFDVQYWVEIVEGVARILDPTRQTPAMTLDGVELRLEFSSGSAQRWRRVAPESGE